MYSTTSIGCQDALGMESTAIKARQITASSHSRRASPDQARLNLENSRHSRGAWIAAYEDYNAWLQIYLHDGYTVITAVATQGREKRSEWVTKYKLQYWLGWGKQVKVQYYKEPQQSGPFKVI